MAVANLVLNNYYPLRSLWKMLEMKWRIKITKKHNCYKWQFKLLQNPASNNYRIVWYYDFSPYAIITSWETKENPLKSGRKSGDKSKQRKSYCYWHHLKATYIAHVAVSHQHSAEQRNTAARWKDNKSSHFKRMQISTMNVGNERTNERMLNCWCWMTWFCFIFHAVPSHKLSHMSFNCKLSFNVFKLNHIFYE